VRTSSFGRSALWMVAAVLLLAGCGANLDATPGSKYEPSALSFLRGMPDTSSYRVLHDFSGRDGAYPLASLIEVNGTLYGTTTGGGTHGLAPKNGVVFSISTSGKERVVHDFESMARDGNYPGAALLDVNGILYGTTELGNKANTGTVFSLTTSGKERVLYRFGEFGPSPMQPSSSLIDNHGTLYSTTNFGGASNLGTVFSISTSGKERVLHSFGRPYRSDGQIPASALVAVSGTLYGTTYEGGLYGRGNHCGSAPCPGDGTVFSISPSGEEHALHSFGNGSDGINPVAGLIVVAGALYGTTFAGGQYDKGTIFRISLSGDEHVLYSFGTTANDGAGPMGNLIEANGRLYGTTIGGGAYATWGTVFSVSLNGSGERVLHSFGAAKDGRHPEAALLRVNGTLYGTTDNGGTANRGTIFALTP
jgi:uncharacterized repeat protein (TIGR03803 family)